MKSSAGFRRRSRRSRGRKRRAFAIALLLAVAVTALVTHLHAAPRTPVSRVEPLPAPVAQPAVEPARAAQWSDSDRSRLSDALRDAFAPAVTGADRWSLAVVDTDGRTIYADRADHAVVPASVQKLIVAATGLDALGAFYRYHTMLAAADDADGAGALPGNLWLIGTGDPSLASSDLRNGVGVLFRSGLRQIDGGVVVDATSMTGPELNAHWDPDDDGQDYAAPTSAISVDGDTVEVHQAVDGADQTFWKPMHGVARYVSSVLQQMLFDRGIETTIAPAVGAAPLGSVVLWDHRSAPLRALEEHMLFVSDNHYAEQLLRTLGGQVGGVPDDTGGLVAERQFLRRRGIPVPGLALFDGSGLSDQNRIAAITLARLLADAEPSLYMLLPLGGRQGTLEDYDFTTALARVRAKSGHITGVSSLAGYVNTQHHGRIAFAFMINGSLGDPDAAIVRAVDRMVVF